MWRRSHKEAKKDSEKKLKEKKELIKNDPHVMLVRQEFSRNGGIIAALMAAEKKGGIIEDKKFTAEQVQSVIKDLILLDIKLKSGGLLGLSKTSAGFQYRVATGMIEAVLHGIPRKDLHLTVIDVIAQQKQQEFINDRANIWLIQKPVYLEGERSKELAHYQRSPEVEASLVQDRKREEKSESSYEEDLHYLRDMLQEGTSAEYIEKLKNLSKNLPNQQYDDEVTALKAMTAEIEKISTKLLIAETKRLNADDIEQDRRPIYEEVLALHHKFKCPDESPVAKNRANMLKTLEEMDVEKQFQLEIAVQKQEREAYFDAGIKNLARLLKPPPDEREYDVIKAITTDLLINEARRLTKDDIDKDERPVYREVLKLYEEYKGYDEEVERVLDILKSYTMEKQLSLAHREMKREGAGEDQLEADDFRTAPEVALADAKPAFHREPSQSDEAEEELGDKFQDNQSQVRDEADQGLVHFAQEEQPIADARPRHEVPGADEPQSTMDYQVTKRGRVIDREEVKDVARLKMHSQLVDNGKDAHTASADYWKRKERGYVKSSRATVETRRKSEHDSDNDDTPQNATPKPGGRR